MNIRATVAVSVKLDVAACLLAVAAILRILL